MSFQTRVTDFLQWNTKADVSQDVHTALCYTVKVDDDQAMSSPKKEQMHQNVL